MPFSDPKKDKGPTWPEGSWGARRRSDKSREKAMEREETKVYTWKITYNAAPKGKKTVSFKGTYSDMRGQIADLKEAGGKPPFTVSRPGPGRNHYTFAG